MKKNRLDLESIKVKSFITDISSEKENTIKGGGQGYTFQLLCTFDRPVCIIPNPNN